MGASANAGNRLPAFARAPALPSEVVYVRRVAQCLPRYHLRFRHEEIHWRLRPCTTSVALDGGANYLFAVDKGPIPLLSLTASKGPVNRGCVGSSRSDLQANDLRVQPKRA